MRTKVIRRWSLILFGTGISAFSSMACKQESGDVLARLGQRDSVTVNEFKWRLEKTYGNRSQSLSFAQKKNFLNKIAEVHLKVLGALDEGLDREIDYVDKVRKAKDRLIVTEARDVYIYDKFIGKKEIESYKKFRNTKANIKIVVVEFNKGSRDYVTRSKAQALKTIDSIRAAVNVTNFDQVAEMISDYKNKQTGRGNFIFLPVRFGSFPLDFENTVFNSSPNSITRPLEIEGAYVIAHVLSFETNQNPADKDLRDDQVRKSIKKTLTGFDLDLIGQYQTKFTDSLYSLAHVIIDQANIDTLVRVVQSHPGLGTASRRLRNETLRLGLAEYQFGNKVTIEDILNSYKTDSIAPALTRSLATQKLTGYIKSELLKQLVVQAGYTESDQFKYSLMEAKESILIEKIESQKIVIDKNPSVEELQTAYNNHWSEYRTAATADTKEIFTLSENTAERVSELIRSGIDFDKAAERCRTERNDASLSFKNTVSYSEKEVDEVTRAAANLKIGEISRAIPRKNGGYSIIQVVGKRESVVPLFEVVQSQVLGNYLAELTQQATITWLNELKRKYPVILFEKNLSATDR